MSSPSLSPRRAALRSALLFANFFLIILAYYQVKPASRSLFLEHADASQLPWLWTGSALLLIALMPPYQALLRRFSRLNVVLATCAVIVVLLVLFRVLLLTPNLSEVVAFYLLVDIFSVVLVEQFWSLTNSVYSSGEGRRWYGVIASGGLLGGLVGGLLAGRLVSQAGISTYDLLLVAAGIIGGMMLLTFWLARHGLYRESARRTVLTGAADASWRALLNNRYLRLIALMLLLAQIVEPLVEYQFMRLVEESISVGSSRVDLQACKLEYSIVSPK